MKLHEKYHDLLDALKKHAKEFELIKTYYNTNEPGEYGNDSEVVRQLIQGHIGLTSSVVALMLVIQEMVEKQEERNV